MLKSLTTPLPCHMSPHQSPNVLLWWVDFSYPCLGIALSQVQEVLMPYNAAPVLLAYYTCNRKIAQVIAYKLPAISGKVQA